MMKLGVFGLALCGLLLVSGCPTDSVFACTCRVTCDGVARAADLVVCATSDDIVEATELCQDRLEGECTESTCGCVCTESLVDCEPL